MSVRSELPEAWEDVVLDGRANGPYGLLHLLRLGLVRRFEASCEDPAHAQAQALARVLDAARGTRIGHRLGLHRVRTLEEYRRAVPVAGYEAIEADVDDIAGGASAVLTRHPVLSLLETSGTTGRPKLLPVTATWRRAVAEAQSLWVMGMVREQEEVVHGKALVSVGSAVEARTRGGLVIGSNTGRMHAAQPWFVRARYAVPAEVFALRDAEVRHYCLLRLALTQDVRSWTTANPSTILALCRALLEHREALAGDLEAGTLERGPAAELDPELRRSWRRRLRPRAAPSDWRPARLWRLACVNCWKGGYAPFYLERLPAALGGSPVVREVGITASEGFFAIPLHSSWTGGVAWAAGHLLELVPEAGGDAIGLHEAEPGLSYRLVVSTTAGLYRYDMNDVVRVVGRYRRAPVLEFVRKGRDVLSVTGEKVTSDQVQRAAASVLGPDAVGFSVGVRLADRATYVLCVEGGVADHAAGAFDRALRAMNVEYEAKRATDRLAEVEVRVLPRGTYARLRREKLAAGVADGQVKEPVIVHGAELDRLLGGWR